MLQHLGYYVDSELSDSVVLERLPPTKSIVIATADAEIMVVSHWSNLYLADATIIAPAQ